MQIVRGDFKKSADEIKESLIPEKEFIAMNVLPPEEPDSRPVVLHVALEAPTYSSHGITEGFRRNGYYVEFVNWQNIKFEEGVQGLRQRLIAKATMCKPDLIFLHIQSPDVLDGFTCQLLSAISTTILYTFDCREKEKSQWLYDLAPHLDYVLFSNMEDVSNCIEQGKTNVGIMQSSADLELYNPATWHELYKEGHDIVFVGGDYSTSNMNFPKADYRKEMVSFLKEQFPNEFTAYGMGQMVNRYVHQNEEVNIYQTSKIAISQNNYSRKLYTSDRIWRIMATGCFCLTEHFEGIETMFIIGQHLDTWKTLDELKDKINFYLHNNIIRSKMADAGSKHVRINHSWQKRFEIFSSMIKNKK